MNDSSFFGRLPRGVVDDNGATAYAFDRSEEIIEPFLPCTIDAAILEELIDLEKDVVKRIARSATEKRMHAVENDIGEYLCIEKVVFPFPPAESRQLAGVMYQVFKRYQPHAIAKLCTRGCYSSEECRKADDAVAVQYRSFAEQASFVLETLLKKGKLSLHEFEYAVTRDEFSDRIGCAELVDHSFTVAIDSQYVLHHATKQERAKQERTHLSEKQVEEKK